MPGKKTWAILAVLAATGVVAWAVLRDPGVRPVVEGSPRGRAADVRAAPTLRGEASDEDRETGAGRIAGRTVGDARPVRATVSLHRLEPPAVEPGGLRERARSLRELSGPQGLPAPVAVVESDENGRFAFAAVPLGSYLLDALDAEGRRATGRTDLIEAGERREVRLRLERRDETLRGRVRLADGAPWHGVVDVHLDRARAIADLVTETDREGRFVARGLPRGVRAHVRAADPGTRCVSTEVDLPSAEEVVLTFGSEGFRGRVLDAEGRPVARAEVFAGTYERLTRRQRAMSDEDGRFLLDAFESTPELEVYAAGFAPYCGTPTTPPAGVHEVRLSRAARLRVRAVPIGGGPAIPGVRVWVFAGWNGPLGVLTDANGECVFCDLPPGRADVWGLGAGWAGVTKVLRGTARFEVVAVDLRPAEETRLDLPVVPAARLCGRVLDARGCPVPSATVLWGWQAHHASLPKRRGRVTADRDGRFAVEDIVPGLTYEFAAEAEGYAACRFGPRVFSEGEDLPIDLCFPPERWLNVLVLQSDTGAPLPCASVVGLTREARGPEGETESDGRARYGPLPEGRLLVSAAAEGFLDAAEVDVGDRSDEPGSAPLVFRLDRAHALAGIVLAPDGTPAADADVRAESLGSSRDAGGQRCTWTDEGGRFRLAAVRGGLFRLRATLEDADGETIAEGEVDARADTPDVVLRLVPCAKESTVLPDALVVRVLGPGDRPVSRGQARLRWGKRDVRRRVQGGEAVLADVVTERDSDAWLEVTRATDEGGASLGDAHVGPIPPSQREIVVRLQPERPVAGRIVDSAGRGVAAYVAAVRSGPPRGAEGEEPERLGSAVSGSDGEFTLRGLGDAESLLRIVPPDDFVVPPAIPLRAEDPRNVVVRLERGARPVITVLDVRGKPVVGAFVRVLVPGELAASGWREGTATDREGKVRVPALDPRRTLDVTVRPPSPDLQGARLREWTPRDTTVRLEDGGVVAGTVRDGEGRPVYDAHVAITGPDGAEDDDRTDGDGRFRFSRLPPGEAVLRARPPGSEGSVRREIAEARVPVGTADAVLVLDPGLPFAVRVVDAPRVGMRRIAAVLMGPAGVARARLDADGTARFVGLPRGARYDVFVGPTLDGRYGLVRDVDVAGGAVSVPLQAGETIRGRVRAPASAERIEAHVVVLGIEIPCTLDADGRFVRGGLPSGRWEIVATGCEGERRLAASAWVEGGGAVDLDLRP